MPLAPGMTPRYFFWTDEERLSGGSSCLVVPGVRRPAPCLAEAHVDEVRLCAAPNSQEAGVTLRPEQGLQHELWSQASWGQTLLPHLLSDPGQIT